MSIASSDTIGHFGKYHNTLCLPPPPKFCLSSVSSFLGTSNGPERKQKQCLCKIWGDKEIVSWYCPQWPIGHESIYNV